jgi:uncharacterized protein YlxP (DUF503 family)
VIVGILELQVRLEGCFSLKGKRSVLQSLCAKSIRLFHVSIAEVDDQDLWNVATLGVAYVSNDVRHAESVLQKVIDLFDASTEVEIESAVKRFE